MDPAVGMAYCYPSAGGEVDLKIADMVGYGAVSPDDLQIWIEWQKRHCR